MAMFSSQIPNDAQHFLGCDIKGCEGICQFFCNDCHQSMCERCRDEHQKSQETDGHEVVPYRERKQKLPVEKCNIHPSRLIDLLCEECQIPLCSKCTATREHRGHVFTDLEIVHDEKVSFFQNEIAKIRNNFEPSSYELKEEIAKYIMEIKRFMGSIRQSMRVEARRVIKLVEAVTIYNIEQVDKIEQSLLEKLDRQSRKMDDYINYLNDLIKTFHNFISPSNVENLTFSLKSENVTIRPIPEISKPIPPVFTASQCSNEDVAKLLGRISVPNPTLTEQRKTKPFDTALRKITSTEKRRGNDVPDVKHTLSLSSVTKVSAYTVSGVANAFHTSLDKSGRFWVSDWLGNLVKTDQQGKELHNIKTSGRFEGYHTVLKDGSLIYADKESKAIKRLTPDNYIIKFIRTRDWEPLSLCSSYVDGDILVGLTKKGDGKVTRYNKDGIEMKNIQKNNIGQDLYSSPRYITENINGDICVSDHRAVVVVDKSGQHRFSYTGQRSKFEPYGICTDILGHILVCNLKDETVHLLGLDGKFLSLLLTSREGMEDPRSVCVDDNNHLWVGQCYNNTVSVYNYLQQ